MIKFAILVICRLFYWLKILFKSVKLSSYFEHGVPQNLTKMLLLMQKRLEKFAIGVHLLICMAHLIICMFDRMTWNTAELWFSLEKVYYQEKRSCYFFKICYFFLLYGWNVVWLNIFWWNDLQWMLLWMLWWMLKRHRLKSICECRRSTFCYFGSLLFWLYAYKFDQMSV